MNTLMSQPDTEVHLADIENVEGEMRLTNPRNISNNFGYDNQPSFYDNNSILFASTRDGQTDIVLFDIASGSTLKWLSDTPTGSEYSPLRIPEHSNFSAIRLDMNGLQRLYEYDSEQGTSSVLVEGAKIGYHLWYAPETLVATILVDNRMDLIVAQVGDKGKYKTVYQNVGRSLAPIPNTDLVSFISKEDPSNWELKSLNPATGETKKITAVFEIEDVCWLADGTLIIGTKNMLFKFNPAKDEKWSLLQSFTDKNINNITRLAVNEKGTRLAFVAEPSPENIVQKQVDAFNARDLNAFAACYLDTVIVRNYPNKVQYTGNDTLKSNYEKFYANTPQVTVEVIKRISLGKTVIDEEMVSIGDKTHHQVAIYEVQNGLIASMTFIHENTLFAQVEEVVEKQLEAYNSRDIDAFVRRLPRFFCSKPRFKL